MKNLKKTDTKLSAPLKTSFWFMMCVFLQRGIAMITTPIFTRILSQKEYGITSTFSSWQSVLEIFVSLELASCTTVLFAKNEDKKRIISSAISSLELIVTSIWMVIILLFIEPISDILGISDVLCICLIFSIMATQIIQLWMGYKRYVYEYRGAVGVTLLITVLSSLFGVAGVLWVSPTAKSRLIPLTVVNLILGVVLYIDIIRKGRVFYDKNIWKFAFSYGIPLLPHYISQFVLSSSDRLMIGKMCGQKEVALYSVAYSVGSLIGMFTYAINASFAPYQFQHIRSKEYKSLARTANIVLIFVAFLLIGIMLFGREIIWIFAGDSYFESVSNIIPICLGVFFNYLFQLFARVEEFYLHKAMIAFASMMCAALNLVLNYMFIPIYGYQAAAYTTFVCYFMFCIVHYLFYKRVLKSEDCGEKIYDMKMICLLSIFIVTAGIIITYIQNVLWLKCAIIVIVLILLFIKRKVIIAEILI